MFRFSNPFLCGPFLCGALLVAGCAAQPSASPAARQAPDWRAESVSRVDVSLALLEDTTRRLCQEHVQLGDRLSHLEGEIAALRRLNVSGVPEAGEGSSETRTQDEPLRLYPAPVAQSAPPVPARREPRARTVRAARPFVAPLRKETPARRTAASRPAPSVAETIPSGAGVEGLSAADLAMEPPPPTAGEQQASSASAPPVPEPETTPGRRATAGEGGTVYLVHMASYLRDADVGPGWRALSAQSRGALASETPYTTGFEDAKGRQWKRLSIGPFPTRSEAQHRCAALKTARVWCDVVAVPRHSLEAVSGR